MGNQDKKTLGICTQTSSDKLGLNLNWASLYFVYYCKDFKSYSEFHIYSLPHGILQHAVFLYSKPSQEEETEK